MSWRRTGRGAARAVSAAVGEMADEMASEMVELRIDGTTVAVEDGDRLIDAIRRAGADVPTLCHDPRLPAVGACRLCLVEVEGQGRPVAACSFPAEQGMAVRTDSAALTEYRRGLLELMLSELAPGSCLRCEEIGPCELHRLARELGAEEARFPGAHSGVAPAAAEDDNPFILRDYGQCISCDRCTAVCNELEQAHAIAPAGHGFDRRIATLGDGGLLDSPCTFCGQCINVCPTGALLDRPRVGRARAEELTAATQTVCPFCGTGCTLTLDVAGDRVVGARPDFDSPVSRGALCIKGQFGWEFVHSEDRLTHPLVRRDGVLEPASWDEALDVVAGRLQATKEQHGPDAMVFWSSARATTEANYAFQRLTRGVVGTNNIDNCART